MHAYLITGGSEELRLLEIQNRLKSLSVSPFDVFTLALAPDEEHIGIDEMRAFKKQLLLAPQQSSQAAGIIEGAHAMTTEAQNALLKLLEEPPPHAIIFAETTSEDLLLPTVVSRCQIYQMKPTPGGVEIQEMLSTLTSLLSASPAEKLAYVDTVARDRAVAKHWVQRATLAARLLMLRQYTGGKKEEESRKITKLLRLLGVAGGQLAVNVNPKLVLDTALLSL